MMGFRELIKRVQDYSGFSVQESKDALEMMVESLACHLPEEEREEFANQLPPELQDIALSVYPSEYHAQQDIVEQFMEQEDIDEKRAKKQVYAAWNALKEIISQSEIDDIRSLLPNKLVEFLH